jgi:hypothetical protein
MCEFEGHPVRILTVTCSRGSTKQRSLCNERLPEVLLLHNHQHLKEYRAPAGSNQEPLRAQTEGQITKVKLVKRQMYGRGKARSSSNSTRQAHQNCVKPKLHA